MKERRKNKMEVLGKCIEEFMSKHLFEMLEKMGPTAKKELIALTSEYAYLDYKQEQEKQDYQRNKEVFQWLGKYLEKEQQMKKIEGSARNITTAIEIEHYKKDTKSLTGNNAKEIKRKIRKHLLTCLEADEDFYSTLREKPYATVSIPNQGILRLNLNRSWHYLKKAKMIKQTGATYVVTPKGKMYQKTR